jgi:uncharacterized membrane protein HdeD (DUF308 family)
MSTTATPPPAAARLLTRFLPPWWIFLITGIAWMLVALIVLRFDYVSVTAISILFGVVALGAASVESLMTLAAPGWWKLLYGFLAVVFLVAGVVAFIHPGDTFVALAAVISFFFVFAGTFDIIAAISTRRGVEFWWLPLVGGIIELALGFWAAGSWDLSATLLVAWVAAAAVIRGVRDITMALRLRELQEFGHASAQERGRPERILPTS